MNILIIRKPILQLGPQFSAQNSISRFSSLHQKIPDFIKFSPTPKSVTFCSATVSDSLGYYGGWDHPQLGGKSVHSGESNLLHSFLISLGIDDKKYVFVYLLGFVCALSIFRVKVSSIVAFPACAIVFAVGFAIGFVNGGHISLNETKRRPKDEILEECLVNLRNLVDLLSGLDARFGSLRNDINEGIECNQITVHDLESFVNTVESFSLSASNAKKVVEGCMEDILTENQETERTLNQKSSRRKNEVGENGLNFAQFVFNLFRVKSSSLKSTKTKDLAGREFMEEVNDQKEGNILAPPVEERTLNSILNENGVNVSGSLFGHTSDKRARRQDTTENMIYDARRMNMVAEIENMRMTEMDGTGAKSVLKNNNPYNYSKGRLHYMNNQEVSWKIDRAQEVESWSSHDGLLDSTDFRASLKHSKTETSFGPEKQIENLEGKHKNFDSIGKNKHRANGSVIREDRETPDCEPPLADHESAIASDDMEFNRCLVEANILLKEAKECLVQQGDNGVAENALYNSASLLLKAVNIRPMSLLAVGQLGNTYLLHGELKLRLSRELRALLARTDQILVDKSGKVDDQVARRDKITSVLVDVCEECEELLIRAGRKYRMALSIDVNDMRALYNWGLALIFRAQLIADIGPDAACEADKVYLAAIDKFDAMMSKSNVYAPDALFRWGAALQQRSRLRPRNNKEKVKLLQQARRLYEDALEMNSDDTQVRNALSSCVSELRYWYD